MWQIASVLANQARSFISERTRTGVEAAKKCCIGFGCRPEVSPHQVAHARQLIDGGQQVQDTALLRSVAHYRALHEAPA